MGYRDSQLSCALVRATVTFRGAHSCEGADRGPSQLMHREGERERGDETLEIKEGDKRGNKTDQR